MMGAALQDGPSLLVSGRQLRAERLSAGLSLNKVALHFRRRVTRQAIHKIELRAAVADSTVSDFRAAIRAARKGRVQFANLKMNRGTGR